MKLDVKIKDGYDEIGTPEVDKVFNEKFNEFMYYCWVHQYRKAMHCNLKFAFTTYTSTININLMWMNFSYFCHNPAPAACAPLNYYTKPLDTNAFLSYFDVTHFLIS